MDQKSTYLIEVTTAHCKTVEIQRVYSLDLLYTCGSFNIAVLLFRVRSVSFHVFQRLVIAPQRGTTTLVHQGISLFYLVKFFEK